MNFCRKVPPSGKPYSYCRLCANERSYATGKKEVPHNCDNCGKVHTTTRRRIYQQRCDRKRKSGSGQGERQDLSQHEQDRIVEIHQAHGTGGRLL